MPKPKIHYLNPKTGIHACGLGSPLPNEVSADIESVTCQRCLATVTAKKRKPGRPVTGAAKIKVTLRLPPDLVKWIDSHGERTSVITEALKTFVNSSKKESKNEAK